MYKKITKFFLSVIIVFAFNSVYSNDQWQKLPLSGGQVVELERFQSQPEIMLCGLLNQGLYLSRDGAKSWLNILDYPVHDISISEDSVAYVATTNGLYISKDFGKNWSKIFDHNTWQVISYKNGIVVADTVTQARESYPRLERASWLISFNYGINWSGWQGTGQPHLWEFFGLEEYEKRGSILFHSDGTVYRSEGSVLYKTVDSSWTTWEEIEVLSTYEDKYLYFSSETDSGTTFYAHSIYHDFHPLGYIAGGVYRSTNKGVNWEKIINHSTTSVSQNDSLLFAGTDGGVIYTFDKRNESLNEIGRLGGYVTSIEISHWNIGEILVTTLDGIFKSTDFGKSWKKSDAGIYHLQTVAIQVCKLTESTERILVSTKNGIWYSDDNGHSWQLSDPELKTVPALLKKAPSNQKVVYSAGSRIYISKDAGGSWHETNTFPAGYYGWYARAMDLDINPENSNNLIVNYSDHSLDHYSGVVFAEGFVNYFDNWDWQSYNWFSEDHNAAHKSQYYPKNDWLLISNSPYMSSFFLIAVDSKTFEIKKEIVLPDSSKGDIWIAHDDNLIVCNPRDGIFWVSNNFGESWDSTHIELNQERYDDINIDHTIGELIFSPGDSLVFFLYPGNAILVSEDGLNWEEFNNGLTSDAAYQLDFSSIDNTMYLATDDGVFKNTFITGLQTEENSFSPNQFVLSQNFPNPFNPTTIITYELQITSNVKLIVYDVLGREVKTLVNKTQQAGKHKVTLNASNLASGVYYYKLKTNPSTGSGTSFEQTRKMLLLR